MYDKWIVHHTYYVFSLDSIPKYFLITLKFNDVNDNDN
jgi:hypothetical protein